MMWQTQTTIEYPFALRPASIEEAGLFYSQMDEAEDAVLGTVGHIRMDFGASGKEFYQGRSVPQLCRHCKRFLWLSDCCVGPPKSHSVRW